jgi:hypothetical protein
MWEWLNTGLGTIGVLGVIITAAAYWSSRETNRILARQAEILQGQRDLLAQMEANAVTRHGAVMDKLEGRG